MNGDATKRACSPRGTWRPCRDGRDVVFDNREDWQNRRVYYCLNADDRARMLELHEQRAVERQRAWAVGHAAMLALAQAIALRRRQPWLGAIPIGSGS